MSDNPGPGPMGLNPMAGMLDSMDMIKRAWSSFNLPASLAPTIDPQELERRIKDLKTVEQWLSVNLGILQSSIQALEAQRSTILAMQAFGEAMKPATPAAADAAAPEPSPQADTARHADPARRAETQDTAASPSAWWDLLQSQFEQVAKSALGVSAALAGGQAHAAGGTPKPTSRKRSTDTAKTGRRKASE